MSTVAEAPTKELPTGDGESCLEEIRGSFRLVADLSHEDTFAYVRSEDDLRYRERFRDVARVADMERQRLKEYERARRWDDFHLQTLWRAQHSLRAIQYLADRFGWHPHTTDEKRLPHDMQLLSEALLDWIETHLERTRGGVKEAS